MGAQFTYGTVGATGGGLATLQGLHPSYYAPNEAPRWASQARSLRTRLDPMRWASLWPTRRAFHGGGADGAGTDGYTAADAAGYEPWSKDSGGAQGIKFVLGMCVDASDVAIPGATVQGFVTSTDAYTGEGTSRGDGSYAVPTQTPSVAHYVVAYIAGSPDRAGTTVNTLVPTNLDGT